MDRLIVKNFGPLKDVDIELNKINLFIGENGSGKSVLAKIITIVLDFKNHTIDDEKTLFKKFQEYYIDFFTNKTIIQFFINERKSFDISDKKITHNKEFQELHPLIQSEIRKGGDRIILENKLTSQYIPAERNLIALFNKSLTTLLIAEVPLPKFLLHFTSEFEKAGNTLKELTFLNVKYVNGDGLDRHKVYFNDEDYLSLEYSSSGIQSALPLYLTVKYFANRHNSIIIEEPEQNLFPKAQTETIKYIVEQVSNENHLFMMTHSPYVLSTLNNLIFAYKVAQLGDEAKNEVEEVCTKEQWINPKEFSAYSLEDGMAKNLISTRGLISENEIDNISDDLGDNFDELMEIYREFRND
jgi:predicted ATPase